MEIPTKDWIQQFSKENIVSYENKSHKKANKWLGTHITAYIIKFS